MKPNITLIKDYMYPIAEARGPVQDLAPWVAEEVAPTD